MTEYFKDISPIFIQFSLTVILSLILGIEQRKHHADDKKVKTFGTDRTFTFIGLLGFALLVASPNSYVLYIGGGAVVSTLLAIFYASKMRHMNHFGFTTIMMALLTYVLPLMISTQPYWLTMAFFVTILIFSEAKGTFGEWTNKIDEGEFLTLAKFIIIAGIILPLIPNNVISSAIPVSPYKIWLAIVVISGISYFSYILRKYVFPKAGLLLTGILGGLYSSTATTIILARKSKEATDQHRQYAGAIIMATAMMFFRIYILMYIFNYEVAKAAILWFVILLIITVLTGMWIYRGGLGKNIEDHQILSTTGLIDNNPLEFKVAIIFAMLYVGFSILTQFVLTQYGTDGLNGLSVFVGFTDIDPFLLNLFQGKYNVTTALIALASLQAILSNNILKLVYGKVLGHAKTGRYLMIGMGFIILANLAVVILMHVL